MSSSDPRTSRLHVCQLSHAFCCSSHVFFCVCTERKQKQPADTFALLPDTTTMEEVLRAVAEKEHYSKENWATPKLELLVANEIFTVGNLRVLSKERIEGLDLPPVVTEYLLRVKPADSPANH